MTNMKKSLFSLSFAILCFLLCFQAIASAEEMIRVQAEGAAAIVGGNKDKARSEAKNQTYRDALEKGVGAYVQGITEMKDFQVVKDKVFSQSQGLVKSFEITREWEEDGIYYMEADCQVSAGALDGVLGPVVIDILGNPRVMVLIDESIEGERPFLSTVEGEVLKVFEKAGYLLVDPGQADKLDQKELDLARETGDVARLQDLARSFRADVIIYGKAQGLSFTQQKIEGVTLFGVRSQVQLKAIISQTGYVLGTELIEKKAKGTSAQDGAVKAFQAASKPVAQGLVNKVAYVLVSGQTGSVSGRTIKVVIEGVNFSQLRKIKQELESMDGVTAVYQRAFEGGRVDLDVVAEKMAEDLAVDLEGLGVEITSLTANSVEGKKAK
ncbi:MAG: hypothetical protein Q7I97_03770 [Thermovirgaceae bacterium]|nr:hypothetical protein [Thermovirgaceae bacterium]